jgi:positive regulator of sigma E activity
VGWTDWLGQSAAIAYASIALGEFLSALVPQLVGRESWIGISVILLFGALQWTGIRASSRVQQATSLIKALAFLALVAAWFLERRWRRSVDRRAGANRAAADRDGAGVFLYRPDLRRLV